MCGCHSNHTCSVSTSVNLERDRLCFSVSPGNTSIVISTCHMLCLTIQSQVHIHNSTPNIVKFEVLTAASMKMAVLWVVAPSSVVDVYRRFRFACCATQKTAIFNPKYTQHVSAYISVNLGNQQ
jgi:hypothetical protein